MIMDFRKSTAAPTPINLCESPVTIVDSFPFLGTIITQVRAEHHLPHQEGPAKNVLPVAAEEVQPAKDNCWDHSHGRKASTNFSGTFKINRINLLPAQPETGNNSGLPVTSLFK
ncbi:hypothetical protein ATANTOWER_023265 [Ataeniobius toweri]|uniref:Uncharacterized protein n=1 Tax=Ataeniobius toweri TaxID=208326 RepID=A0ABU7B1U3_9TELE|nr:hypothetical protein [Ataeniobius toweri]